MWITSCTVSVIAVATVDRRSHCIIGKQYIKVKMKVDHFILVLNLEKNSVVILSGLMFHQGEGGDEDLVTKRELDQHLLLMMATVGLLLKRELHPLVVYVVYQDIQRDHVLLPNRRSIIYVNCNVNGVYIMESKSHIVCKTFDQHLHDYSRKDMLFVILLYGLALAFK